MLHVRAGEVEEVRRALNRTQAGSGELVVIEALPGLGRTTLAGAAAEHAAAVGLTTLVARGSALERGFAHGVVGQLLERAVQERSLSERRHLLRGPAAVTRPLLDPRNREAPWETDAFLLAHGLCWVIARLAERNPVAVVVDDVHLVDAPSLLFLSVLVERLDELGCTVILTAVRSTDQDPNVAALVHHQRGQVIQLEPLPVDQLAEWLFEAASAGTSPSICRTVAELSGGNPALADLLLAAAAEVADLADAEVARHLGQIVDSRICEALKREVDCLSPSARRLVTAAAFLEGDAVLQGVAHVADLGLEEATESARALVDAGLATSLDPLEPTSPTISGALRALVSPADAAILSRRAADALARSGRGPEVLAPHLLRTAPSGDESVVACLWPAADHALRAGDPQGAVAYLRRSLAEPAPADVRPDLLLELGQAEARLGDDLALVHLEEAAATLRDRNLRARALLSAGRLHTDLGHPEDAVSALRRGQALQPPDEMLRRELFAQLVAAAQLDLHQRHRRAEWSPTAPSLPKLGDATARALLAHLALDHVLRGEDLELAEMWARSLVPRLMATGASGEAEAVTATAGTLLWLGDPSTAAPLIAAALPALRQSGDVPLVTNLTARRAMVRAMTGDLPGAVLDGRSALETGVGRLRTATQAAVATALLALGDIDGARHVLPTSDDDSWQSSPLGVLVAVALGDVSLAQQEPRVALERYTWAAELAQHASIGNPLAVPHLQRRAEAHLRLGETSRARELAEESLSRAEASGLGLATARARITLARTADEAATIALIEPTLLVFDRAQVRLDLAAAQIDLGVALLRAGHHHDGVKHLHEAEGITAECGAQPLLQRARSHLRAAGARARRPRGPGALTPSERRVADLARTGLTNREIAAELYVSSKAVEWHLGNIYRKLDVHGRPGLKALLDLDPPNQSVKFSQ